MSVQPKIDLIQFEYTNCIRSICTKTNTTVLHTNLLHSILRKIGHVIQIVVHQFVRKTSAEKKSKKSNKKSIVTNIEASPINPVLQADLVSEIKQAQEAADISKAKGEQAAADMF